MPTFKTPLIGSYNQRSFVTPSGKDQYVKGAIITRIVNKQSNSATYYTEKRGGLTAITTPASGQTAVAAYVSTGTGAKYTIFSSAGTLTLYKDVDFQGTLLTSGTNSSALMSSETLIDGITYILMTARDESANPQTGWYLASDANTTNFTANRTSGNVQLASVSSFTGRYVGQLLTGTGIAAGARIASMNVGGATIDMTIAATSGAATATTITPEAVSKIIDADFPTLTIGTFAEMDGFVCIITTTGRVYNSDLNTVASWSASNYILCNKYSDGGLGLFRYRNRFLAFNNASLELLYNAGNASGSPFNSGDEAVFSVAMPPPNPGMVAQADGNVFWVGADGNLYRMEGFSPKKVSALGTDITSSNFVGGFAAGSMTAFYYNRKTYLNIKVSASINYWYSVDDDTFSEPNFPASAYCGCTFTGLFFALANTGGKIYSLSTSAFQDNGAAFTMSIQLAIDMGTQGEKFLDEIRLIGDVQASGSLSISYSDDDGVTYSTPRLMSLTSQRTMSLKRWGSFMGTRLVKFEHSANTPFRAEQVAFIYRLGKR